ncbi:hypothetical protein [Novipirellula aureliae]|uniref:hypothetical protein n=1 Tax=Novipirellula aureliae TaxID=2527966 RepID=UPI0011B7ACA1|nr:hypothetical protein [Novipirellula aureliae]
MDQRTFELLSSVLSGRERWIALIHCKVSRSGYKWTLCAGCKCLVAYPLRGIDTGSDFNRQYFLCKGCEAWIHGDDPPDWWREAKRLGHVGGFSMRKFKSAVVETYARPHVPSYDESYVASMGRETVDRNNRESKASVSISRAIEMVAQKIGPKYSDDVVECRICKVDLTSEQKLASYKRSQKLKHHDAESYEVFLESGLYAPPGYNGRVDWLCDRCFRIDSDKKAARTIGQKIADWLGI